MTAPCNRCGGPRTEETFQGVDVVACQTCGAVTLARADLERLVRLGEGDDLALVGPERLPSASVPPPPPRREGLDRPSPELPLPSPGLQLPSRSDASRHDDQVAPDDATAEVEATPQVEATAEVDRPAPGEPPLPQLLDDDVDPGVSARVRSGPTLLPEFFDDADEDPRLAAMRDFPDMGDPSDADVTVVYDEVVRSVGRGSPEPSRPRSLPEDPANADGPLLGLDLALDDEDDGPGFDFPRAATDEVPTTIGEFSIDESEEIPEDFLNRSSGLDDDDDFVGYRAQKRRRNLRIAAAVVVLVLGVGALFGGYYGARLYSERVVVTASVSPEVPRPSADASVGEAVASEEPAPDAAGDERPDAGQDTAEAGDTEPAEPVAPAEAPAEAAAAEPAPAEPAPAPRQAAAVPSAPGPRALVSRGWNLVGSDTRAAERAFRQALDLAPADAEANYGLGYALLRLERRDDATRYLCEAMRRGGVDIQREVTGLMATNDIACP